MCVCGGGVVWNLPPPLKTTSTTPLGVRTENFRVERGCIVLKVDVCGPGIGDGQRYRF